MLGGADNPNGELPSYITGADMEGDPLEVAQWLQACHDAGIEVRVQINESSVP